MAVARRPNIARTATRFMARRESLAATARLDRVRRPSLADLDGIFRGRRPSIAATGARVVSRLACIAETAQEAPPLRVIVLDSEVHEPVIPIGTIPGLLNPGLAGGLYRPWARVLSPATQSDLQEIEWTQRINAGWSATLKYRGLQPIDFPEEQVLRITVNDGTPGGGVTRQLPPMIAEKRTSGETLGGPSTTYELVDQVSYKLSQGGRDLPTFERSNAREVAQAVAAAWGVQVVAPPSFPILEEDVADSDGWAPLLRLAAVAAQNVLVTPEGRLRFVDCRATTGSLAMRCSEIFLSRVPSLSYSGVSVVKTSSLAPGGLQTYTFDRAGYASFALKSPLRGVIPGDRSTRGGLGYLGLWSGPPSAPESKLLAFHLLGSPYAALNVPISRGLASHYPVTHATVMVSPPAQGQTVRAVLELNGSAPEPPFPGAEPAFALTHGNGRRISQWQEQLLPSRSYVSSRIEKYLWEASKKSRPLNYSGRLDLRMAPTVGLLRPGYPANRAESVTHRLGVGSLPTTSVEAVCL